MTASVQINNNFKLFLNHHVKINKRSFEPFCVWLLHCSVKNPGNSQYNDTVSVSFLSLTFHCFYYPLCEFSPQEMWVSFSREILVITVTQPRLNLPCHPGSYIPTFQQGSSCTDSGPPDPDNTLGRRSQAGSTPAGSSGPACSCSCWERRSPGPLGSSSQRRRVPSRWCWPCRHSSSQECRPGSR